MFDVEGARKAGYSDHDIASYLAQEKNYDLFGAVHEGHSYQDIINHLNNHPGIIRNASKSGKLQLARDFTDNARAPKTIISTEAGTVIPNHDVNNQVLDYLKKNHIGQLAIETAPITGIKPAELVEGVADFIKSKLPTAVKASKALNEVDKHSFGDVLPTEEEMAALRRYLVSKGYNPDTLMKQTH